MSTQDIVEATLKEILCVVNPLRSDVDTRMQIINELRDVVSSIENLKGATVEPFGSFSSQLFSRWGDLDISIEQPIGQYILVPAKKHKQMLLGDILRALRRTGSFRTLQFVSHARVPILKLESKLQNISCDISINNLSGHMKSKFLLWISLIDRRFRDMVLLVKEWAKANGINNPRNGTLNSYSLSLLVIFHFQTCTPAILPPLQDLYPGNMADELQGVRADIESRIEEVARINIARFRKERRVNHSSLSQLFISFLAKFLGIDARMKEHGICTFSGRWESISTNTTWLPKTYAVFIEDPFEQPENTARAVVHTQLTSIGQAFRNTYNLLIDPYQSRNTIIPALVRHEISYYFREIEFVIPRDDVRLRPYQRSNQNGFRANHPSAPFQHQFQRTRHPRNSNRQNVKQSSLEQVLPVNPQGASRHEPAPPVSRVVRPPRPHTAQPSPNNTIASQRFSKASPAAQVHQVWRQKPLDK